MKGPNGSSAGLNLLATSPANIFKRRSIEWRGLQVETFQATELKPFEFVYSGNRHLLVAVEAGSRQRGESGIDGLPISALREYSGKLTLIPSGHKFFGWQVPRVLARLVFLYIDPKSPILPPDLHFGEAQLEPRLYFSDRDLWQTALKLKHAPESATEAAYVEALELVLAHELLRVGHGPQGIERFAKGGLAAWQKKRVADHIEEHFAEEIPLLELAQIAGLSPYHFARTFKVSFGMPPHHYVMNKRIERAKQLLAKQDISITEIGFELGFRETSAFTTAFRKMTLQTPSEFRRSMEERPSPLMFIET
jgi:AraC family transcriptional regulator